MSGGKEDWRTCLEFLKMFVRISTLRHILLFRMLTCLQVKDYSRGTVSALQKYIKIERKDKQTFLAFFSLPSLENVGVLAFFNPSEEEELITYLEQLRLSVQNFRLALHDKLFLITPKTNPNILFGRPLASVCSVRAMKSSTDTENERIRFKFTAIESEFNLFHIQSPDLGEYIFMKENSYCKYSTSVKVASNSRSGHRRERGITFLFYALYQKMAREIFFYGKDVFRKRKRARNKLKTRRGMFVYGMFITVFFYLPFSYPAYTSI